MLACSILCSCDSFETTDEGKQVWAEYADLRGRTLCAKSFECCSADQRVFATMEQCERSFGSPLQTSVERGETGIDMSQAERCFDDVARMDCDRWTAAIEGDYPTSCSNIIQGKPEGASCETTGECSEGWCGPEGTCKPFQKEGEACSVEVVSCTPGVRCALQRDGSHLCETFRSEGASCGSNLQCSSIRCEDDTCTKACWAEPGAAHLLGTGD